MQKYCPKCGSERENETKFCGKCGYEFQASDQAISEISQINNNLKFTETKTNQNVNNHVNKSNVTKSKKGMWIIVFVVVFVFIGYLMFEEQGKQRLADNIRGEWSTLDPDDSSYILNLYFDGNECEYTMDSWLGELTISTLDYEVISSKKIIVNGMEVEVNISGDTITFYPSFVNDSYYSMWFR